MLAAWGFNCHDVICIAGCTEPEQIQIGMFIDRWGLESPKYSFSHFVYYANCFEMLLILKNMVFFKQSEATRACVSYNK